MAGPNPELEGNGMLLRAREAKYLEGKARGAIASAGPFSQNCDRGV